MNKVFQKKNPLNPGRGTIRYCRAAPGINRFLELYPEDILRNPHSIEQSKLFSHIKIFSLYMTILFLKKKSLVKSGELYLF